MESVIYDGLLKAALRCSLMVENRKVNDSYIELSSPIYYLELFIVCLERN